MHNVIAPNECTILYTVLQFTFIEQHLHKMLGELAPDDKAAIVLRYWYDFSEKEISDTLNLSVSAVKSRLHRSRKKLAQIISDNDPNHSYQQRRTKNESPAF